MKLASNLDAIDAAIGKPHELHVIGAIPEFAAGKWLHSFTSRHV